MGRGEEEGARHGLSWGLRGRPWGEAAAREAWADGVNARVFTLVQQVM